VNDWTSVEVGDGPGAGLGLDLPPGWWWLRPGSDEVAGDVSATVAEATRRAPEGSPLPGELAAELGRLARASDLAGAVVLAGGTSVDRSSGDNGGEGSAGTLVTASLAVVPFDVYAAVDRTGQREGPADRLDLPAGATMRHCWLGPAEFPPLGVLLQLEVAYVVSPPRPPSWVLLFRTPALRHTTELVEAFDGIANTLRVGRADATVDVLAAFS